LSDKAEALKVGSGLDADTDINPLIRETHAERVLQYIEKGEKEGARLVLDGREKTGQESKNHLGATIFEGVTTDMDIWKEEIFGTGIRYVRVKGIEGSGEPS